MEKSLYNASWYRVADLRPRLHSHTRIHRHHYRGQIWYMFQDRTSGRFQRFSPPAYLVISLLDGKRTVQEIWDLACEQLGDDTLTQDDMIRLLSQLHSSNLLYGDVPPDLGEISERASKMKSRSRIMSFINPLVLRVPIFDPDNFLQATLPLIRPLLSWFGALLYVAIVGYAIVLAGMHWSELTDNIADRVLAAESLLLLVITYPFVKAIHELGHGYAVKKWGGEVHEIGIMFLVFVPVPYVDASDATSFHEKWHRALVGAAGILVELLLSALALFVWLQAEEGLVSALAYNVMLIGGVSTLFFNGNPLLKFDGYYVFSDIVEIPNLQMRANRYLGYLIQRHAFGVDHVESPAQARGEAPWFFFYGIASFLYRITIVIAIISLVATKFFALGVLLALWSFILMVGVPLGKCLGFLLSSPVLRRNRSRAMTVTAGFLAVIAASLTMIPLPYSTIAEGVLWMPDEAAVYVQADGEVSEIIASPNSIVRQGDSLVRMEEALLDVRVEVLESRVRELTLGYEALDLVDSVEAKVISTQLEHARADLALARERKDELLVRSTAEGQFILANATDLPGRFLRKGEVLGYVVRPDDPVIRVVVTEDDADLVRNRTARVEIRYVDEPAETIPAVVEREVPSFSDQLPSAALSTIGGGDIFVDPSDTRQLRVLDNLLQLEVRPASNQFLSGMGKRVYVRFVHDAEPLAWRLYRTVRQVFLRRFNV